jgi:hypothetical protein
MQSIVVGVAFLVAGLDMREEGGQHRALDVERSEEVQLVEQKHGECEQRPLTDGPQRKDIKVPQVRLQGGEQGCTKKDLFIVYSFYWFRN